MADHVLTLNLTEETLARLQAAARGAGVTPHDYAVAILEQALAGGAGEAASHNFAVQENDTVFVAEGATVPFDAIAQQALAEYDRTGEYVTLDEAMKAFEQELEIKLAARR